MIGQKAVLPLFIQWSGRFLSLYSNLSFAGKPDWNGLLLLLSCCLHKYSLPGCRRWDLGQEMYSSRDLPSLELFIHNAVIIAARFKIASALWCRPINSKARCEMGAFPALHLVTLPFCGNLPELETGIPSLLKGKCPLQDGKSLMQQRIKCSGFRL